MPSTPSSSSSPLSLISGGLFDITLPPPLPPPLPPYHRSINANLRVAGRHFLIDTEDIVDAGNEASDFGNGKAQQGVPDLLDQICLEFPMIKDKDCERIRRGLKLKLPKDENTAEDGNEASDYGSVKGKHQQVKEKVRGESRPSTPNCPIGIIS